MPLYKWRVTKNHVQSLKYDYIFQLAKQSVAPNGEKIPFLKSLVMAAVAGGCGGFVGTPGTNFNQLWGVEGLWVLEVLTLTSWGCGAFVGTPGTNFNQLGGVEGLWVLQVLTLTSWGCEGFVVTPGTNFNELEGVEGVLVLQVLTLTSSGVCRVCVYSMY